MEQKQSEEVRQTMAQIYTQIAEREGKDTAISNITYYKEFTFSSAKFIDNDIFIVKLQKTQGKDQIQTFEIYNKEGEQIGIVDEKGKIQFRPEYIEKLRDVNNKKIKCTKSYYINNTQLLLDYFTEKNDDDTFLAKNRYLERSEILKNFYRNYEILGDADNNF